MRINTKAGRQIWMPFVIAIVVFSWDANQAEVQDLPLLRNTAHAANGQTVSPPATDRENAERLLRELDKGIQFLESDAHSDYTADVVIQERLNQLGAPEVLAGKFRHTPRCFYLRWRKGNAGRELLFVEGTNKNQLKIHSTCKIPPMVNIAPDSRWIIRESR